MTAHTPRNEPAAVARLVWAERYPSAKVLFCGGSVVRGGGYASSDLDIVVVYEQVPNAWRESFFFRGWPVEVFAHDPETLSYFVAQDVKQGRPSLAHMVAESLVVPGASSLSAAIQTWARSVLAAPPAPSPASLAADRYAITDLLNDFRDARPRNELVAVACTLYPLVSNFVLKAQGCWRGSGKTLPALLDRATPTLAATLAQGFETFFASGDKTDAVRAIELALQAHGGELFDGFRSDAPVSARAKRAELSWLGEGDS